MVRLGIPKETAQGETRVAATPDSVKRTGKRGWEWIVERGAGEAASFPDTEFEAAGARIADRAEIFQCDIVMGVRLPPADDLATLREGALLVSLMDPGGAGREAMELLAARQASGLALELIPRITRAQAMDVLSSQANLAGYRAVVEAAHRFGRLFPMMMTAAGSVPPARVFVLGVGVAGLQAIATARRLGAQVEAFDVRPEVAEQIVSVGAKVLDLGLDESGAGEGGYARELGEEAQERLRNALARQLARADIVITTAQIPGRPAPVLVTEAALQGMKPGSVVVDLAAASGGNCPLTVAGETVERHGVLLVGETNHPAKIPTHASQFFARNMVHLLEILVGEAEGGEPTLALDLEDEILDAAIVTHGGEVRWPRERKAVKA